MTNVEKIAELRDISTIDAICFWRDVSAAAGLRLSTYDVLTLLEQGECTASISADQLVEKRVALESERIRSDEARQAFEATRLKELKDQREREQKAEATRLAEIKAQREKEQKIKAERREAEENEFRQLVSEMSALRFTQSREVSAYIVRNKLGHKYKHISGILDMEMDGTVWKFNGGFRPEIYARLCEELGLKNQGSRAVPREFTPYKNIL